MSTSSYANCHFCGDIVKAVVANTHQCPTCMRKPKTCKQCGKEKTLADFAYNMSKDSIKFEDPRNDVCQGCQIAKALVARDKTLPVTVKMTDAELGIIEMVKQGLSNLAMADKMQVQKGTLGMYKSKLKKKLDKAEMSFESYPKKVVEG